MVSSNYSYSIIIIIIIYLHSIIQYKVLPSNTNNIYTIIVSSISVNTNNLHTIIWLQVTIFI